MELIAFIVTNWKVISGGIALIITWNKDAIMNKLNITSKKKEIEGTTSDNVEKNLGLYQKMLDDYAERKEAEDVKQRLRISNLEAKEERQLKKLFELEAKVEEISKDNEVLRDERDRKTSEISGLREEIHEIKSMLNKALKQLEFYKENSDLDLPDDLK